MLSQSRPAAEATDSVALPGEDVAALRREVETLRAGLESNRLIGAAMGILMAERRLSRRAAFELLRELSQSTNVKLLVVAERLVLDVEDRIKAD